LKKQQATALAILGPPGCGKTTLMKYITLIFAMMNRKVRQIDVQEALAMIEAPLIQVGYAKDKIPSFYTSTLFLINSSGGAGVLIQLKVRRIWRGLSISAAASSTTSASSSTTMFV